MPTTATQTATLALGHEIVQLRAQSGRAGLLIERESGVSGRRSDAVRITQVLLASERSVRGFLNGEPYPAAVEPVVSEMLRAAPQAVLPLQPPASTDEKLELLAQLAHAKDETELIARITPIGRLLGATTLFFFLAEEAADGQPASYRILTSNAEAAQVYVARKWYATDPFLTHARHSSEPFYSSDVGFLENLSGSLRDMGEWARAMDLKSWLVMPAHSRSSNKFGVLYAANSILPSDRGEEPLRLNQPFFRSLSAQLFEWYAKRDKAMALKTTGLSKIELQILNARYRGLTAEMIAETLGLTVTALRRTHTPSINAKLSARSILEATKIAAERGLLAVASERKVAYVVHSPQYGVFLREDYGCLFFSRVNPEDLDEAELFPDAESAQRILNMMPSNHDCKLHRVDVHHTATTASIDDCINAGLSGWEPTSIHTGAPPDDSATPGALGVGPVSYH